ESINTVVIGGGQAGLSVGHHLASRGVDFVILDARQRIGDVWRSRWDSLRVFTPAKFSGLDGMPYPAHGDYFPTKDEYADYLEACWPLRGGRERLHVWSRNRRSCAGSLPGAPDPRFRLRVGPLDRPDPRP